jgi:hypothetical protein
MLERGEILGRPWWDPGSIPSPLTEQYSPPRLFQILIHPHNCLHNCLTSCIPSPHLYLNLSPKLCTILGPTPQGAVSTTSCWIYLRPALQPRWIERPQTQMTFSPSPKSLSLQSHHLLSGLGGSGPALCVAIRVPFSSYYIYLLLAR